MCANVKLLRSCSCQMVKNEDRRFQNGSSVRRLSLSAVGDITSQWLPGSNPLPSI